MKGVCQVRSGSRFERSEVHIRSGVEFLKECDPGRLFTIQFTLLFTYLFGGALAGSPREYLQQLLPGIVVMTVTTITMYTGMNLNTDIGKGVFDRFRSLPIWRPAVLVGMLLADAVRYAAASLVVVTLGVILGFRPDGGPIGVALAFTRH